MDLNEILKRFALIADLSTEEAAIWSPICNDAMLELTHKLKSDADTDANAWRLNAAAASLAFYRYTLYRASGSGMDAFSAGDIKITPEKQIAVKAAYAAWCEARNELADLLVDDEFLFEQVRIS